MQQKEDEVLVVIWGMQYDDILVTEEGCFWGEILKLMLG